MKTNSIEIIEEYTKNEQVRKSLIAFLKPHETQALFLLGNLQSRFQPSCVYVAQQQGQIVGVCGYYPTFQSCSIYSESPDASRALAQVVLKNHSSVNTLTGMARMVKPAYDEFIARGRVPTIAPEMDFFELSVKNFKPFTSSDGIIRPITDHDVDDAARLNRLIHHKSIEDPIKEEERLRVKAISITFCLEIDGKFVAVASSNGLAIKAFQILGVATHPDFQRKGYAKAVCSHLILSMQEKGAEKAIIFTGEENVAARKCYLDLGFQITDRYYVGMFQPVAE